MDLATDPASSAQEQPRILPILRRLVPDPCREWIDSPYSSSIFDYGDFCYCRQRRGDGLTAFVGLAQRGTPDRFATEKVEWQPVWPVRGQESNVGRCFELWCADLLRHAQAMPPIDGRIPAVGVYSWRGDSGGGGSRPYYILVERAAVLADLERSDADGVGLRAFRCGLRRGKVALLFPRLDETDRRRRFGFSFLLDSVDACDALSRRWTGMKPAAAREVAEDMLALAEFLEDPEIAALAWPEGA